MVKLSKNNFTLLKQIHPEGPGPQTFFHLVENELGDGYIDSLLHPGCGLIVYQEDMIVVGDSLTDKLQHWLEKSNFCGLLEVQENLSDEVGNWFPEAIIWERAGFEANDLSGIKIPDVLEVKRLSLSDLDNLKSLREHWLWKFAGGPAGLIDNCDNFGVYEKGRLVSLSSVFAGSLKYADVAVATHPDHRGRGYARLCAGVLTDQLLRKGRIPVWNTSPDNIPSMKIPLRLGYREIELRTKLFKINWNISTK